eukprot:scaffold3908_cov225-Chaetoceros_neogracile.AAC.1
MMYLDGNGKRTEVQQLLHQASENCINANRLKCSSVAVVSIFVGGNSQQNDLEDEKREAIQAILNPLAFITSDTSRYTA